MPDNDEKSTTLAGGAHRATSMPERKTDGRGTRVAEAPRKTPGPTPRKTRRNIALCVATGREAMLASAWAGWVHAGEIANAGDIFHPNLTKAYAAMSQLLSPGDVLDNIWVYAHGDGSGYLWAYPDSAAKERVVFNPDTAKAFVEGGAGKPKNLAAAAFHQFSDESTKLHMWCCNGGIAADALRAARLLFCGSNGSACGPAQWLYYTMKHLSLRNGAASRVAGCAPVVFETHPSSYDDVMKAVAEFNRRIDADLKCFPPKDGAHRKSLLLTAVDDFFNKELTKWFDDLHAAQLVPPAVRRGAASGSALAHAAIWDMVGAAWPSLRFGSYTAHTFLVTPFLSSTYYSDGELAAMRYQDVVTNPGHIFPRRPEWKKSFKSIGSMRADSC